MSYTPGFGDEATWGAYFGHPHDPRAPEYEDEFEWPEDKDWEMMNKTELPAEGSDA